MSPRELKHGELNRRDMVRVAALLGVGVIGQQRAMAAPERPLPTSPEWPSKLVLGLVPSEGSSDITERFKPMARHFERVLGVIVESTSSSDYAGVITAMDQKHVDIAYLGPKAYVEAASRTHARAVAVELDREGIPGYHSLIVARADSGYKTIDDIAGKTFAFTDPNSASGCLVPTMHFKRDRKIEPKKFFKEVRFAGSHPGAVLAAVNGSVDAAATNDLDLARVVKSGQVRESDLVVLWKSELIPGCPMVVRKDLPESLVAAIIGSLMTIGDDKDAIDRLGNGGYLYTNDAAYDVMRYLINMQNDSGRKQP